MNETAAEVGRSLREWLERGGPEWQLLDWLRGYDLPAIGDDEPYLWLIDGLEAIDERDRTSGAFCERVKAVLESRPDLHPEGRWPERVLYNLFMLCACLHCPRCLAEPLEVIFRGGKVGGNWRGLNLRSALRRALIENQVDTRFHDDWRSMMTDGRHPSLPGDAIDGFAGIVNMHPSLEEPDEPVVGAILEGLTDLVERFDGEDEPILHLEEVFDGLERRYPNRRWAYEIEISGTAAGWPKWARNVVALRLDRSARDEARKAGKSSPREAVGAGIVPVVELTASKKRILGKDVPMKDPVGLGVP